MLRTSRNPAQYSHFVPLRVTFMLILWRVIKEYENTYALRMHSHIFMTLESKKEREIRFEAIRAVLYRTRLNIFTLPAKRCQAVLKTLIKFQKDFGTFLKMLHPSQVQHVVTFLFLLCIRLSLTSMTTKK